MRAVVLLCMRRSGLAVVAAALAAACGDPAARVRVTPLGGNCARPAAGNLVKVTAYSPSGDHSQSLVLDQTLAIGDFPGDTEQIAIEVVVGGGAIGAMGKSPPLDYGALPDGAMIPVAMAPPGGFCELPAMREARGQPLVATAGDGALVLGGVGEAGPLSSAEYFDAATQTFSDVAVPQALVDDQGFTGAALATLPDGRVAVIGGPQRALVVFDPARRVFATDPTLIDGRAFHAAIATGEGEVLVAGGCSGVAALGCSGVARLATLRYALDRLSLPDPSATLASGPRIGGQLFDIGVQRDGRRRYVLAGGTGVPARADRFALDDTDAEAIAGGRVQAAALDGGAVLTAFGDDAAGPPADGTAAVFAPGVAAARSVATAPALRGVRLIALEDGRVAGFGGDAAGRVELYDPARDAWTAQAPPAMTAQTGPLSAPSLARLPDGTVLVVGGDVSPRAWLYRPSLIGPASGSVTAIPASDVSPGVLTAPDPATVTRVTGPVAAWLLTAPADPGLAAALVGGPRIASGSVRAVVQVMSGGVALIAQHTGPGQAIRAELTPGASTRLVQLAGGAERELCTAPAVAMFDPAAPVTLELAIRDHDARLSVNDAQVLACTVAATERGAWGIASLGAGARLVVNLVTVAR